MNVEPNQILKKDSLILKRKDRKLKESEKMQLEDLEGKKYVRSKMKMTLEIKTK